MIDFTVSSVAPKIVGKRLRHVYALVKDVESAIASIDRDGRFSFSPVVLILNGFRTPEEVEVKTESGIVFADIGIHLEWMDSEFTEVKFVRSLRRLIEVALLRIPIPQEASLAIRDAVDNWAKKHGT